MCLWMKRLVCRVTSAWNEASCTAFLFSVHFDMTSLCEVRKCAEGVGDAREAMVHSIVAKQPLHLEAGWAMTLPVPSLRL